MTFSIVARDPDTGQLGLGTASRVFGVGRAIHHVRGGVGAVASQAMALPLHATRTLDGIAAGQTASAALAASLADDDERERRQVLAIAADGTTATHTGAACIPTAEHRAGTDWVVAGNILADDTVVAAMVERADADPDQPLARRLLAVLQAAQDAGGDLRGRQSAALLVVGPEHTGDPLVDRLVDIRVDDHPDPLDELERLLVLAEAGHVLEQAERLLGEGDGDRAARRYRQGLASLDDDPEFVLWTALSLQEADRADEARELVTQLHTRGDADRWRELTRRLVTAGMLDEEAAQRWW